MKFTEEATEIANFVMRCHGPFGTREQAIKYIETYLKEMYRKGWNDKQKQLASNYAPRTIA